MTPDTAKKDLAFLTAEIKSPPEALLLLRASLELALLKLGHPQPSVTEAVDSFYARTLH